MKLSPSWYVFMICLFTSVVQAQERPLVDAGDPFGMLPLVDEVIIGTSEEAHNFVESGAQVSAVEEILGRPTRVLINEGETSFIGYRIGAGAGLEAGAAYVLSIDYPEDAPRTLHVINRGGEYGRGFSTGPALGDVFQTYTHQNLESINYPLSQEHQTWKSMFFLHERYPAQVWSPQGPMTRPETPADGFMVYIAQPGTWSRGGNRKQAPRSAGAAISRIRLFAVPDPEALSATITYPPEGLPRRHLFWREEMSDGAVHQRNNQTAVDREVDWFEHKAKLMSFLGMNTYAKDLLEFGANQGWDSNLHGGNDWVHHSDSPQRWSSILEMLGRYDFYVLPMYEYAGSKGDNGLGYQRRARPLRRDPYSDDQSVTCDGYTHIWWAERANVDVADPDTFEDLRKMLDATIIRHKDRVRFLGAWLRTRNSSMPVSFSDFSLNMFSEETQRDPPVTRAMLIADVELKETYVAWWLGQRKKLFAGVRDLLHEALGPDSVLLFTAYHEEPGPGIYGGAPVTDDVETWTTLGYNPRDLSEFMSGGQYLQEILAPMGSWDDGGCMDPEKRRFEWDHSSPRPDPENTRDVEGFLFTYPFNRLYSVTDPAGFEAFRGPAGLAMIRHYSLNEHGMDIQSAGGGQESPLGYFVADVDRAGPYAMFAEARALAFGDPRYIGYLSGQSYNRGFPQYVRRFNEAFLSLPAVPSTLLSDASADPEVVVRAYPTAEHGEWFAIINTSLNPASQVTISIPGEGVLRDGVTLESISSNAGEITLDLYPGEVRSLHLSSTAEPTRPNDEVDEGVDMGSTSTQDAGMTEPQSGGALNEDMTEPETGDDSGSASTSSDDGGCSSVQGSRRAPWPLFLLTCGLILWVRRRADAL